jgi:RNAse (barnase) inhibitor barstar
MSSDGDFMLNKALFALVGILMSFQVMASGSVLINGKEIKNREQLHALFAKDLNYSRYGKTIDSLYENLSLDFSSESIIKIKHVNLLKAKLGTEYITAVVNSIIAASEENSRVILVLE